MAVAKKALVEEARLASDAQDGCAASFEQLYRGHVGRVYALCLRMAGNATVAEDMTQEAFVRAWESLASFRGESALGTWLCRIAINVVLMRRRKEMRRAAREVGTADFDPGSEIERASPVRRSDEIGPGLRMDLEEAIAALPEGARTVFVLHDVEGYRHQEIAEQIGIALGTSKAHLHRARRLLREMMRQ